MKKRTNPVDEKSVLENEFGGPTYFQIVIQIGEHDGEHKLIFDRGHSNHWSEQILIEKHTVESLIERIKGLDLNSHYARSTEAQRAARHVAYIKSLPPRAMG